MEREQTLSAVFKATPYVGNPTPLERLAWAFCYWRKANPLKGAAWALVVARQDVANGKTRYPSSGVESIQYSSKSESGLRWIENPNAGLRCAGYADELAKTIRHTGWFMNEFQDESARGVVYRLPAKHGESRFVPGIEDPNGNDAALIEFESYPDEIGAANRADRLAENYAEAEREYQEAWRMGSDYAEQIETIAATRKATLALMAEFREAKRTGTQGMFPAMCESIRDAIAEKLEELAEAKAERTRLYEECSHMKGTWRDNLWRAFCDGAGLAA